MGNAAIKLIQVGMKFAKVDVNNPVTIDNADFLITIGKGALKIAKELIMP